MPACAFYRQGGWICVLAVLTLCARVPRESTPRPCPWSQQGRRPLAAVVTLTQCAWEPCLMQLLYAALLHICWLLTMARHVVVLMAVVHPSYRTWALVSVDSLP